MLNVFKLDHNAAETSKNISSPLTLFVNLHNYFIYILYYESVGRQ